MLEFSGTLNHQSLELEIKLRKKIIKTSAIVASKTLVLKVKLSGWVIKGNVINTNDGAADVLFLPKSLKQELLNRRLISNPETMF